MPERMKDCPNGHGAMELKKFTDTKKFRGEEITFEGEYYVCPVCGLETGTVEQAAGIQRAISDAYRSKVGLLTSREIREGRERLGWSQRELAQRMGVGIASIKRWEGGLIQTRSMDLALRRALQGEQVRDVYTGNRPLSLPRIKLVLKRFEEYLRRRLLVKHDRMLYAAKYLWYADMVAFRELGRSITGATYARLPHGPQLNNYRDLVDKIMNADELEAEPLTLEEERIIKRVSMVFPSKKKIYGAAHREKVWERRSDGDLIPYSDADELQAL